MPIEITLTLVSGIAVLAVYLYWKEIKEKVKEKFNDFWNGIE